MGNQEDDEGLVITGNPWVARQCYEHSRMALHCRTVTVSVAYSSPGRNLYCPCESNSVKDDNGEKLKHTHIHKHIPPRSHYRLLDTELHQVFRQDESEMYVHDEFSFKVPIDKLGQ